LERELTPLDFVFIRTEFFSGYGRPDILAACHNPLFAFIIEK
jgi:hypothetical protein